MLQHWYCYFDQEKRFRRPKLPRRTDSDENLENKTRPCVYRLSWPEAALLYDRPHILNSSIALAALLAFLLVLLVVFF